MPKEIDIMKRETTLPADFDGVFRFTNWSKEEFVGVWNKKEYHFPAESTSPMIIPEHSPLEIQHIRKKFAKDLAEREFFKGQKYETMRSPEGALGNRTMSGIHTANTYTDDDLVSGIQMCLQPLQVQRAGVTAVAETPMEERLSRNDDGELNTVAIDKKEVVERKARDRQREIDEGVKLSGQVDTLREVRATEEQSLEKFRRETVSNIATEIDRAAKKKELLLAEVALLEDRREKALEPLTKREYEIKQKEIKLIEEKAAINWRRDSLATFEENLETREKSLSTLETKARYTHEDAVRRLEEADIMREAAERKEQEAREILERAEEAAKEKMHDAADRERKVKDREEDVADREKKVQAREIFLNHELVRLNDRVATLERTLKRKRL